jgi:ParB-like chromosome segregation protein Spo0J
VVRYCETPLDDLTANPKNWRIHSTLQQECVEQVIAEAGFVQPILVNVRTGYVLDGHLRVALALRRGEATLPTIEVDLSEDEEALVLATLDPLSAMAAPDTAKLDALVADIQQQANPILDALVADIHGPGPPLATESTPVDPTTHCPNCGYTWSPKEW